MPTETLKGFPSVIYFDTNILNGVALGSSESTILKLKSWVEGYSIPIKAPEVVVFELAEHCESKVKEEFSRFEGAKRSLEGLLNKKIESDLGSENHDKLAHSALGDKLSELNIEIADTPENIPVRRLMAMAAFKVKPFEKKGEKGFRDTILLYTIIEDIKKNKFKNAILISGDAIFNHEDVQGFISREKVDIKILESTDSTSEYIGGLLTQAAKNAIEAKNKRLLNYANTNKSEIFRYINKNAELTDDFVKRGGLLSSKTDFFGQIDKILEFKPYKISYVFELPEEDKTEKDVRTVLIGVTSRLKVRYLPILFSKPRVKVTELEKYQEIVSGYTPPQYGPAIEVELERELSLRAKIKTDAKGAFMKMTIISVNTL